MSIAAGREPVGVLPGAAVVAVLRLQPARRGTGGGDHRELVAAGHDGRRQGAAMRPRPAGVGRNRRPSCLLNMTRTTDLPEGARQPNWRSPGSPESAATAPGASPGAPSRQRRCRADGTGTSAGIAPAAPIRGFVTARYARIRLLRASTMARSEKEKGSPDRQREAFRLRMIRACSAASQVPDPRVSCARGTTAIRNIVSLARCLALAVAVASGA
jgi:hypothetical protein